MLTLKINLKNRLLEFKKDSNFKLLSAKVLNMGSSSNLSSITINVGKENIVVINQPVIIPDGVIGKTVVVGKTNSIAQLITDVNYPHTCKNISIWFGRYTTISL